MGAKEKLTSIGHPVPELPVADVERAQQHYRDALGFEIGWLYPGKEIGAVSRGNVAIFFRKRRPPFRVVLKLKRESFQWWTARTRSWLTVLMGFRTF